MAKSQSISRLHNLYRLRRLRRPRHHRAFGSGDWDLGHLMDQGLFD